MTEDDVSDDNAEDKDDDREERVKRERGALLALAASDNTRRTEACEVAVSVPEPGTAYTSAPNPAVSGTGLQPNWTSCTSAKRPPPAEPPKASRVARLITTDGVGSTKDDGSVTGTPSDCDNARHGAKGACTEKSATCCD